MSLSDTTTHFGQKPPATADNQSADDSALQFGKWKVVREVARGGCGVVYEAVRDLYAQRVAVKLPLMEDERTRSTLTTLLVEELQRATALEPHPNVVPIYDVGQTKGVPGWQDDTPFAVMPFFESGTLESLLAEKEQRREFVPYRETVEILLQVARPFDTLTRSVD